MEKKKIIISGLVVMILIAIVSAATYAYFIAGVTRNNTTAGVTGTTGTLASVLLRGTGLNLEIDTNVGDFYEHDNVNGVNYYAVSVGEGYASARQNHVLGQVAINGEGTFNCTYEVEVKGSNVPTNMVSGDGKVIITGDGISNGIINISDLKTTQTVNGAFTGINNTSSNTILVDAYLTNTNTEQDYLQGVNIGIEVSVKDFSCTSVSSTTPVNQTYYWTGEGPGTTYNNATKYTNVNSVPNNIFMQTLVTQTTVENDIYEIKMVDDGEIGYSSDAGIIYNSQSECEEALVIWDGFDETTCVIKYAKGDTYEVQEDKVCGRFSNGTACVAANNYANIDTIISEFEAAGATCTSYDTGDGYYNVRCTNGNSSNLINCNMADSGGVICSNGDAWVRSDGNVGFGESAFSVCFKSNLSGTACVYL